ncbi:DUF317 domain-containing protein [Streptomyces uncialis]|uniref:DUF317 domain-containing protein n=1 Tax=Streptomyces uncialis TaxID=1048205 RepID=UPI0037FDFD66
MTERPFFSRANGPTDRGRINRAEQLYEISPRHLAGGGDPRHVTEYLLARGWSDHSVPGYPHVLLQSPDQRLQLVLEPGTPEPRETWWRVSSASAGPDPDWVAHFGGHTPVEMVAAFTDALLNPPPAQSPDIWPVLAARGWTLGRDRDAYAVSPDRTTHAVRHSMATYSGPPLHDWRVETSPPRASGGLEYVWGAKITDGAPVHAVAAFMTALADPAPLLREHGTQNFAHRHAASSVSPVTPDQQRQAHQRRLRFAQGPRPRAQNPAPLPPRPGHTGSARHSR